MSSETTVFVTVKVKLSGELDELPEPKQDLDEGEFVRLDFRTLALQMWKT